MSDEELVRKGLLDLIGSEDQGSGDIVFSTELIALIAKVPFFSAAAALEALNGSKIGGFYLHFKGLERRRKVWKLARISERESSSSVRFGISKGCDYRVISHEEVDVTSGEMFVRVQVEVEKSLPSPLEPERWEPVKPEMPTAEVKGWAYADEAPWQWAIRNIGFAKFAHDLAKPRIKRPVNFIFQSSVQSGKTELVRKMTEVLADELRRQEPDFEAGWNAYRRELLETVGMTMLPLWEKLPDQVKESWCVGVRAALGE
jgi:hypothetical protein